LVAAVIESARRAGKAGVSLSVHPDNARARRLYASLGFVDYGLETKSLKMDGRYYDEFLMAKDLSAK